MRILQITADYYPKIGGVERHVRSISEQLAGLGHDVVVATMTGHGRRQPAEWLGGVRVRRFGSIGAGSAYRLPIVLPVYLQRARDASMSFMSTTTTRPCVWSSRPPVPRAQS